MAASLMARLRESQSKPTVQPAPEQMQQSTGQQLPRSLIGFLRQQQASQEKTAPQDTARHRNLFEAALQQQEQQMPQNAAQAPQAAERPRNLVEFMLQAQALNQQPDSIPAMMKPGEYVLPPDTVQALGGPQVLDATVAQTHTPANAGAIVPKGFEPRLFFNNGGLAQDEEQKPKPISPINTYPQGSPSAGANVYGGAIDATKSAVSAAANPQGGQPLVKGAAQMFGQRQELQQQGRERWDASVAARQPAPAQPVGLPGAASASPSAAPAVTSGFASSQDGMANDFGRQPSSPTPMASAAPSLAPKTPASDPQSRINEQMANAQRQRAEGIAAVQRGQAYDSITQQQRQQAYDTWQSTRQPGILPQPRSDMRQQEAEKAYSDTLAGRIGVATPSKPPEQLAKQLGGLDRHHAQNVQLQAAGRTPEQARTEAAEQPTGQQVPGLSGVYKHGEGQYSDNAQGMGLPQNLGQPSAQNMQAANNLAGQEQKRSMMSVMREQQEQQQMQQPRGFAAPQIQHSGNSSTSKDELRRLRWAAESAMANAPRKKYAMQDPAVMAYQAALQGDTAARYGGQAALEAKTNDTNAGLQREQMQQDGANQREQMQQQGANQRERPRTMMDAVRLDMERQTQGFANRAAAQQEQLRNTVLDEQATPEQRNTAQRNLAALAGRTGTENLSNNFMRRKVPVLNDKGFPTGEQREDIVDLRTGRVLEAPAVPPGAIAELRRNPQLAELFDDWFGPGASRAYLGGR